MDALMAGQSLQIEEDPSQVPGASGEPMAERSSPLEEQPSQDLDASEEPMADRSPPLEEQLLQLGAFEEPLAERNFQLEGRLLQEPAASEELGAPGKRMAERSPQLDEDPQEDIAIQVPTIASVAQMPRMGASDGGDSSFGRTVSGTCTQAASEELPEPATEAKIDNSDTASNNSGGRLPLRVKMLLGLGESVQGIYVVISGYYLNTFLLETACIDPVFVGLIQAIQGGFDAINDPLIGRMSDRTRTRWGRRRPWLLFAAPVLAVFYFALWNALGHTVSQWWKFVYHLFVSMGVSAGITSIQVQIGALVPELTDDYDERTSVSAFRLLIGNFIGFCAAMSHNQIVYHNRVEHMSVKIDMTHRYRLSGAVFAVVLWASSWITFFGVKERFEPRWESRRSLSLRKEAEAVIRNKGFLCVVGAYLAGPTAIVLIQGNILMFCKYHLGDARLINYIIPAVQGTALAAMPFWVLLSKRYGKRWIYIVGGSCLFVSVTAIWWVQDSVKTLIISFFIGASGPIVYLVPYSMLPDVILEDELRTGKRREGIFVGFFTIVLKLAVTGALTITNFVLKAAGYRPPMASCGKSAHDDPIDPSANLPDTQQPQVVIIFFRILCGPLPAAFILMAMLLVWLFPISRSRQLAMAKLAAQARLERCTAQSETSSVTSTHSPRDVKELTDFIESADQHGERALNSMTKEYTEVRYEEYEAQYRSNRISKVRFEGDDVQDSSPQRVPPEVVGMVQRKPSTDELDRASSVARSKASASTDEGPSSTEGASSGPGTSHSSTTRRRIYI